MSVVRAPLEDIGSAVRERASFGLYLAALALLPIRWLSPLGSLSERSGWTEVLVAAAACMWAWERARGRRSGVPPALRGSTWRHLPP